MIRVSEPLAVVMPVGAILAGLIGPAMADYVGDNHSWMLTCNVSGYVLKSKYPVSRFIEGGANSTSTEAVEEIYLGRSCDAEHKVLGKGKWCWANGGFRAEFSSHSIGFPRQELSCPNEADAISGCEC
jgi:hypothetical protein